MPTPTFAVHSALALKRPIFWSNPIHNGIAPAHYEPLVAAAIERLHRFAPLLAASFDTLKPHGGHICSQLLPVLQPEQLISSSDLLEHKAILIKADHMLAGSGSIKARGAANAVLEIMEQIALAKGISDVTRDANSHLRSILAEHEISVGSTGNLGLAIGAFAKALGFKAVVHMSAEAKAWKKEMLRQLGAHVVEHTGDYTQALAAARNNTRSQNQHFIDDEDSESLLLGYATAATELAKQLDFAGIEVSERSPLFVYLPCGVGGAPTGIALGLALLFESNVHCFYAEPIEAPCMILEMTRRGTSADSVHEIGLSGKTIADGLAVAKASLLAAQLSRTIMAGGYTVSDETMLNDLRKAHQTQNLQLEPSAAAGIDGVRQLAGRLGKIYLEERGLQVEMAHITHVVWTTGGSMMPKHEFQNYLGPT
ncbi:D-serine ammonia-lyase [Variovorax sp. PCZ-1]|nr:D-serine ammonia-lyase [Variovorax sp. PCZ-1]